MDKTVKNDKISVNAPIQGAKKHAIRPRPYMTGRGGKRTVLPQGARLPRKASPLGNLKFIPLGTKPPLKFAYAIYFCGIFEADRKPWRPVEHQQLGMQKTVAKILGLPLEDLHCRILL